MAGFSPTNRILLYVSFLTSPASFLTGMTTNLPIGAGFLGYSIYQQYLIYVAAQNKDLHALCLLPQYLNTIYAFTYIGGVPAANHFVSALMCIGTIAGLVVNLATTWVGYLTNIPEGYGVYQFFFFGWRTLTPQWRKMFLCWSVLDVLITIVFIAVSIYIAYLIPTTDPKSSGDYDVFANTSLLWGSVVTLVLFWPIILWTELIIQRNNIVSATDMISVYLFIAQIALLVIPTIWNVLCG